MGYLVERKGETFLLTPPLSSDPEELRAYGGLPSSAGSSKWRMPARLQDLELLTRDGIDLDLAQGVESPLNRADRLDMYLQTAKDLERQAEHPAWATLMPHQRVGVGYLASRERALLAFTPGLGKSATAIVAADLLGLKKILVVAPLTLLPTWGREIAQWAQGCEHQTIRTVKDLGALGQARWTIVNPDKLILKGWDALRKSTWDLIIFDESILYKNRNAKRTKAAQALGEQAAYAWLLSGSPIAAYADDLYSQLVILRPDAFRSYWRFAKRWCHLQTTPWATDIVGNRDPEGLRRYLRDLMLSRTPTDLPFVLPGTLQEVVTVEPTAKQLKLINQIDDLFWVDDQGMVNDIPALIAQMTRLSQAVSSPRNLDVEDDGGKALTVKRLLADSIAQLPAIVWVHFQQAAQLYVDQARADGYKADMIRGDTMARDRDEILQRFQNGQLDVLVMQLQTGKFGLSLTSAKSMVYADRSFSSDDWIQSVARVRRLSSKWVVPTFVLHMGFTDNLTDIILSRKLKSVRDLSLSDLRMARKGRK